VSDPLHTPASDPRVCDVVAAVFYGYPTRTELSTVCGYGYSGLNTCVKTDRSY